ncbi:MAG: helicase-related protein [Myxococcota bacterium]|nr:helicase-related protein [Myxococcota bacterium]
MTRLPIEDLRSDFEEAISNGPVVLSAPTGSGKSTQVPRWLMRQGRVLVVEPRRVACRALASRVASLEGCTLGGPVGYAVRDERRASRDTAALFVTPGVALRMLRGGDLARYETLVLDEFHERNLDLDLLLALVTRSRSPRLVVMSATLAGDRIAGHIGGVHLSGEGRLYPVSRQYLPGRCDEPDIRGLEGRVCTALKAAANDPGDVLVFLPGKGEIASVAAAVQGDWEVVTLHGGLTLKQQTRIFSPTDRRRVILSTNVAETSLTVPRIGVVIDSGLVRRTHYHQGRAYLTLTPIAADSAEQRAGRAGRLGPGVCYRLWPERLSLLQSTPPEIHRESLVPLLLAAQACGASPETLPFLDPPRPYAVNDAMEQLRLLGAIDPDGQLTPRGESLFGLPLDAHLGRLLIEAGSRGTLDMALPLAAALAIPRRLLLSRPEDPEDDLRDAGCDATALIKAVQDGEPRRHHLDAVALRDARQVARRFRGLFSQAGSKATNRADLAMTLLAAWPDCAHLARRRKRQTAWSNGGTELALGRETAINPEKAEAILVLESRAFGQGRKRQLVITAAMPVPIAWLVRAGLGRERLGGVVYKRRTIMAKIERVYAGRVIATREETPQGALAREATRDLILRGRIFPGTAEALQTRHAASSLAAQLDGGAASPPLADWLLERLETLGMTTVEDLELLEPDDVLPAPLPAHIAEALTRRYPPELSIGDARYRIAYDPAKREATLEQISGQRKSPPPDHYLPRLPGWRLLLSHKNRVRTLRGR